MVNSSLSFFVEEAVYDTDDDLELGPLVGDRRLVEYRIAIVRAATMWDFWARIARRDTVNPSNHSATFRFQSAKNHGL